jgi:hypothetical protein
MPYKKFLEKHLISAIAGLFTMAFITLCILYNI